MTRRPQLVAYLALEQVWISTQHGGDSETDDGADIEPALLHLWNALNAEEHALMHERTGTLEEKNDTCIYIGGELVLGEPGTEKT